MSKPDDVLADLIARAFNEEPAIIREMIKDVMRSQTQQVERLTAELAEARKTISDLSAVIRKLEEA